MTLGVLAALAVGQWATAAVVVLFMHVGDYVERFTAEGARRAIKDLALGLILFQIGEVFERSRIRATAPRGLRISAAEVVLVMALVFVGCGTVAVLAQPEHGIGANVVMALLLATAAVATAPAATLFVLQEYEAKGPTTETILAMTGANTRDTTAISLMRMFIDGPDVSLNGSPTVSPTTEALCASDPLPP